MEKIRHPLFDNFEIHPMVRVINHEKKMIMDDHWDNDLSWQPEVGETFYLYHSVFGHYRDGGTCTICDCESEAMAEFVYNALNEQYITIDQQHKEFRYAVQTPNPGLRA